MIFTDLPRKTIDLNYYSTYQLFYQALSAQEVDREVRYLIPVLRISA